MKHIIAPWDVDCQAVRLIQSPKMRWLPNDKPLQRHVLVDESQWKAKITTKSEFKVAETIKATLSKLRR